MTHKKKSQAKTHLDDYEKELEENVDKAEPLAKKQKADMLAELKISADNYMTKSSRISIRVYGHDLEQIKQLAIREGLPYQTLITSILHKYATGQLENK